MHRHKLRFTKVERRYSQENKDGIPPAKMLGKWYRVSLTGHGNMVSWKQPKPLYTRIPKLVVFSLYLTLYFAWCCGAKQLSANNIVPHPVRIPGDRPSAGLEVHHISRSENINPRGYPSHAVNKKACNKPTWLHLLFDIAYQLAGLLIYPNGYKK